MNIIVCIKQVPDSTQIRVHPVTNTIMRQGVPSIINPYDLFSLEQALRLKDTFGATVTVLSMGPPMAVESLRKAVAFGADHAVLLTDRLFAGSDTLATSFALASAIQKLAGERPVDLVFAGKQTINGDTAQVGPGIARRLGFQPLTYVSALRTLDRATRTIVVERRAEGGVQVLKTRLPALITMLEGTTPIRYPDMPDMFRAARTEVTVWSALQAGIATLEKCGLKGSPTVVKKVFAPKSRKDAATIIPAGPNETPETLAVATLATLFAARPHLEAACMGAGDTP